MLDKNITNIYDFIEEEKKNYEKEEGIKLEDGWEWSMKDHLRKSFLYLNSQFSQENENRKLRPFKNIVTGMMNLQYRTVDFDVKDIELFVENKDYYYKSLLVNKFHRGWALKYQIDTFIDRMVVSYSNYGGVLVKKTTEASPKVIDLRSLAFCNQANILANPFGIKHNFSFASLRKENKKWGGSNYGATISIEDLIRLLKRDGKKEVEVYEVHGLLPKDWVDGNNEVDYYDEGTLDVYQVQVVCFYKDENKHDKGVTLFRQKYPDINKFFKFLSRDEVEGRALGRGGVEELFEAQRWTNWDEVKITEMLEAASKTILWSTDPRFKGRNKLINVENNEVLQLTEGKTIQQLDTYPRNLSVFNDAVQRWHEKAREISSAPESLTGKTPSAGTPFKLYEAEQVEGKSMHIYRQGKLATFMDEIYRDWILPHLASEITNEHTFMESLSTDEMQIVVERVVRQQSNKFKKQMILGLQVVNDDLVMEYEEMIKAEIVKGGNKKFFEILKNEMKDVELSVFTNIAGKQKNLAAMTDKLVNILRQYMATPQIRQDPEMTKILNTILESSGISPIQMAVGPTTPVEPTNATQPIKEFSNKQLKQQ